MGGGSGLDGSSHLLPRLLNPLYAIEAASTAHLFLSPIPQPYLIGEEFMFFCTAGKSWVSSSSPSNRWLLATLSLCALAPKDGYPSKTPDGSSPATFQWYSLWHCSCLCPCPPLRIGRLGYLVFQGSTRRLEQRAKRMLGSALNSVWPLA